MSKEELEQKMKSALIKAGKEPKDREKVISFMINTLKTDQDRLAFYKQWEDKS